MLLKKHDKRMILKGIVCFNKPVEFRLAPLFSQSNAASNLIGNDLRFVNLKNGRSVQISRLKADILGSGNRTIIEHRWVPWHCHF